MFCVWKFFPPITQSLYSGQAENEGPWTIVSIPSANKDRRSQGVDCFIARVMSQYQFRCEEIAHRANSAAPRESNRHSACNRMLRTYNAVSCERAARDHERRAPLAGQYARYGAFGTQSAFRAQRATPLTFSDSPSWSLRVPTFSRSPTIDEFCWHGRRSAWKNVSTV